VLKATLASVLALAVVVSVSACGNKQETATPAADSAAPATAAPPATMPDNHPVATPAAEVDVAGLAKPEGGKTVAEIYAEKDALADQQVTLRGKVVKVNAGVMNMDWLHVRDGSGAEGTNDLTVTTTAKPTPAVGDTVLVTGKVARNKDYGMGYQYPVIVEQAQVTVEPAAAP
jgi:predicted small lipoprotein YifL